MESLYPEDLFDRGLSLLGCRVQLCVNTSTLHGWYFKCTASDNMKILYTSGNSCHSDTSGLITLLTDLRPSSSYIKQPVSAPQAHLNCPIVKMQAMLLLCRDKCMHVVSDAAHLLRSSTSRLPTLGESTVTMTAR